jgi:hypothetical protein
MKMLLRDARFGFRDVGASQECWHRKGSEIIRCRCSAHSVEAAGPALRYAIPTPRRASP